MRKVVSKTKVQSKSTATVRKFYKFKVSSQGNGHVDQELLYIPVGSSQCGETSSKGGGCWFLIKSGQEAQQVNIQTFFKYHTKAKVVEVVECYPQESSKN